MALKDRKPRVHHSDRGVQYASGEYTSLLKDNGVQISISRKGNPYDNAKAESFMKTLKYEQVYLSEYENLADARAQIGHFLEAAYNQKRLHSSLGYLPPAEFEKTYHESRDKNQTIAPQLFVSPEGFTPGEIAQPPAAPQILVPLLQLPVPLLQLPAPLLHIVGMNLDDFGMDARMDSGGMRKRTFPCP